MLIYPKLSGNKDEREVLIDYVIESGGCEMQMFKRDENVLQFIKDIFKETNGQLKEITVHTPLDFNEVESLMINNRRYLITMLKKLCLESERLNTQINFLIHTKIQADKVVEELSPLFDEMTSIIGGYKVYILVENSMMYENGIFPPFALCLGYNHPQIKMCLDTTHYRVLADLYSIEPLEFLKQNLMYDEVGPEKINEIIHCVHFASKLNDGYKNKKTHGRKHSSITETAYELNLLKAIGIRDARIITEVSEDNYILRCDQIEEIEMLKHIMNSSIEYSDIERLAKSVHDKWMEARILEGWTYGLIRDGDKKESPCIVEYELLSEDEKEYDRNTAMETIEKLISLGYKISK